MWLLLGFPSSWKFIWRLTEVMWRVRDRGNKPWNFFPFSVDELGGKPWNTGLNLSDYGKTQCLPSSVRLAMREKAKEMTQSDDNSNQKTDSESHQDKLSEATTSMPQSRSLTLLFSPDSPKDAAFKKKRRTARRKKKKKNQQVKATRLEPAGKEEEEEEEPAG